MSETNKGNTNEIKTEITNERQRKN